MHPGRGGRSPLRELRRPTGTFRFATRSPVAQVFLNRFLKAAKVGECDQTTEKLCEYLCELTLQEYTFIKYRPSEIAAAALRLALHTMRLPSWSPLLQLLLLLLLLPSRRSAILLLLSRLSRWSRTPD